LDLEAYHPTSDSTEPALITSVGQLKEKKGFHDLVRACQVLKQKGYSFQCQIIGEGPLRPALEQQIRDLQLESCVVLCGALPHELIVQEYQRSILFVLPCITASDGDRDGIPNVILEALAMQLPVVSTRHSGIPEVVSDGVNGLLVPPADVPLLVSAMERLLNDSALRAQMGARGRQTVMEKFDITRNANRLLAEMVKA
jgi:glycosyltransferase involved in cell wall biosynthesis